MRRARLLNGSLCLYRWHMAEFDIVDLSVDTGDDNRDPQPPKRVVSGQEGMAGKHLGTVDTSVVAAELEALRQDLAAHVQDNDQGLRLTDLTIKLTLGAEGKVAFIAKGTAEACIEVRFSSRPQ